MKQYIYTEVKQGDLVHISVYRIKDNKPIHLGFMDIVNDSKKWKGPLASLACIIYASEEGHTWDKQDHSLKNVEIHLV